MRLAETGVDMDVTDETIIALVRFRGDFIWFRSEPDYWILDDRKWGQDYLAAGYGGDPSDSSHRFGIAVVNQETAHEFVSKMTPFLVPGSVLKEEFLLVHEIADDWFDIAEYLPVVFVDFDSRRVWSIYTGSPSLEEYVPKGWEGFSEGFFDRIPSEVAYWVVDGTNSLFRFLPA